MSIFYKADYNKKESQNGDNSNNQENNNLNTSSDSISRLANRFKTIITVLYYITVAIILLATFALIVSVADNRYVDNSVIFLIILGGIFTLIINEVFWGMTATIIEIRDNTAKAILNKQNDKGVL
tara:strand:- start:89 stop:463 length:375 start_codon:yes stop_codon:yes gene_type:complete